MQLSPTPEHRPPADNGDNGDNGWSRPMNKDAFLELAHQIMPLPTAPYHEQFVGGAIAAFAASRNRAIPE